MKTFPKQNNAKFKWRKNQKFNNQASFQKVGAGTFQGAATSLSPTGQQPTTISQIQSPELDRDALIVSIKAPLTFQTQMQTLIATLHDSRLEVEPNRELIFNDLTQALVPVFPLNRISFFGSSVTGLDTQGSDLDVYIAHVKQKNKSEITTLKTIRHLLFKCRNFCDVLLISGAKVPIIKCIHTKTQICCDLNIKNKLAVCNSNLVKYYLDLDESFRVLMQFIKFWAETCKLKKVNFFSGYSLYLLVIFYLQQKPFNLPSVRELQEHCPPDIVDGWNCGFNTPAVSSAQSQDVSILDLTRGFFLFYADFDYFNYVVSPYLGRKIHKLSFNKQTPEGFPNTLKFEPGGGISIQDPFELDRDISACIPPGICGRFGMLCRDSARIMSQDEKEMMFKLFNPPTIYKSVNFNIEQPVTMSNEKWSDLLKTVTQRTLEDVMNFRYEAPTILGPRICYVCVPKQYVFTDRFKIMRNLPVELRTEKKEIEIEKAVTDCIVKYLPKGRDPPKLQIILNLIIPQNAKFPVKVEFLVRAKCKQFPHFGQFLLLKLKAFVSEETLSYNEKDEPMDTSTSTPIQQQVSGTLTNMLEPRNEDSEEQTQSDSKNGCIDIDNLEDTLILKDDVDIDEDDEDEEEFDEDVPANFFDDFDEDFMDGLDIVDAWDEGRIQEDKEDSTQIKHSPIRYASTERSPGHEKKRSKSESEKKLNRSGSKGRSPRSKVEELRRDPTKTRRDIDRDKQKIAKDKEMRIVSDKLNLVETGLIVPGMEMEVDINTIIPNNRSSLQENDNRKITPEKSKKHPPESRDSREHYHRKSMGRELTRRRSQSREYVRKRYSRSPVSYRRPRDRSRPPRRRSRKRTSSKDSNVSERELWIRTRKRSRSRDSLKRKSKSRKYEEEKKRKSFLEEIREKLNEVRPAPVVVQYPHPSVNVPHHMNPVGQYFPTNSHPLQHQYDESFFIGDGYQVQNNFNLGTGNIPAQPIAPVPGPAVNAHHFSPGIVNPVTKPTLHKDLVEVPKTAALNELFADKKISLSDFLTIAAKSEVKSSRPEHLQKKIKVISRCQEVIKLMSEDRKFNGRLCVKSLETRSKNEMKYQSPLRRVPVIRFNFTSPVKITETYDAYAAAIDRLLLKSGISKEEIDAIDLTNEFSSKDEIGSRSKEKSCEECRKHKQKEFFTVGTQCESSNKAVEIGVQVSEADFAPSGKGLLKNDSIAYLTPAQLLNKEKAQEFASPEKNREAMESRGGFRKDMQSRSFQNTFGYNEPNFAERNQPIYDSMALQSAGFDEQRFQQSARYPRLFDNEQARMNQFQEENDSFTNFHGQYTRDRNLQRFGPRF